MENSKEYYKELVYSQYHPADYIYKNAERMAAEWLFDHAPKAKNPVMAQIDFHSWRYTELIMALREAYVAGMIQGATLQEQINNGLLPNK